MLAAIRVIGWTHIHCFAHTLNLVIQEAIKADLSVTHIKKKYKDVMTFFHHSVNASEKLKEIQRQIGLEEKKLI